MDLRPYGLNLKWTPETEIRTIGPSILISAHVEEKRTFVIDSKKYTAIEKINQGSFGVIYKVEHEGKHFACKVLRDMKTATDFQAFLNEVIIHILLLQASMEQRNGPYVPYLYKVAYDKTLNKTYMITEWMECTLRDYITQNTKSENDIRLPTLLAQIAHILQFFGKRLQFNHRDLHSGNIMIGHHMSRVTLIDFGYSCLRWEGVDFKGPSIYNAAQNPCYKKDRDIPFLCMELYMYYDKYISEALRKSIHTTLIARIQKSGAICNLGKLCPEHGVASLEDRYEFLNKPTIQVPAGAPKQVEDHLKSFRTLSHKQTWFPFYRPATPRNRTLRNRTLRNKGPKAYRTKKTLRRNNQRRTIPVGSVTNVSEKGVVGPLK
jgi:serine/threonine protein kinase